MKPLEDRLMIELGEIADQATTSPGALAAIRSRAASIPDEQEVVVMLVSNDQRNQRHRWVAPAFGAALAVVLVVVGVVVLASRTDDVATVDDPVPSTPPSGAAAAAGEDVAAADSPSDHAVDIAERWGKAWESGDTDAVLALYSSDLDERYVVDQTHRAVWRDVEAAIEQIDSVNDFDSFELVRVEEFSNLVVADYQVQWAPKDGSSMTDTRAITVVFIGPQQAGGGDEKLIVGSDIYVPAWVNLFGVDYEIEYELENGDWITID